MKRPISWYKKGRVIRVSDKMQRGYEYALEADYGKITDPIFKPELSPQEMLKMGVFEGKYLTECKEEFPIEWYKDGRMTTDGLPHTELNYFKIKSRQPLKEWRR